MNLFEERIEHGVNILAAAKGESGGMSMAVDGAVVVEVVHFRNPPGGTPADEFLFDGGAVGMVADDAFAAVAVEIRFGEGFENFGRHVGSSFIQLSAFPFWDAVRGR